jgi:hypothetical protein
MHAVIMEMQQRLETHQLADDKATRVATSESYATYNAGEHSIGVIAATHSTTSNGMWIVREGSAGQPLSKDADDMYMLQMHRMFNTNLTCFTRDLGFWLYEQLEHSVSLTFARRCPPFFGHQTMPNCRKHCLLVHPLT